MIAAERRNRIKEIIFKQGSAKAEELARQFQVSEETIRRDFTKLAGEGYIEKNYGGAVAVQGLQKMMQNISPVQQRKFANLAEKSRIGEEAARLIQPGMRIFLDAGSTTWSVLRFIQGVEGLTVITNSLDIARDCAEKENWRVIVLGGEVVHSSMALVGPNVEQELSHINVDIAFLGTSGISCRGNCTSANLFESNVKRRAVEQAGEVVLLADSSKLGEEKLYTFAKFTQLDLVITSEHISDELKNEMAKAGVELKTV
ncbi:DeoR/GlpR family DNA-binding transcription regulator [Anaerolentibacter hominis]|uniref:DeoR/GlpR family DNA-binding transcription regulator n=1 Tax=Anaerolentibacter hominis TaxID=3079009 RepID=UPI0031B89A21